VSSFEDATENDITFAVEPRFTNHLDQTSAAAVIVPDHIPPGSVSCADKTIVCCENPKIAFFKLVETFYPPGKITPGINPGVHMGQDLQVGENPVFEAHVFIGDHVRIGNNVRLMPGVYVGDRAVIGDDTVIRPNVTIMERTCIGKRVLIHSGTVIGSDGFGFARNASGHQKLIHTGYVCIGDDSEIGACNTIDRGTLGVTEIGCGVKTDNQVHIAHNVKIGDHSLLVAQVGIAGSTRIGKNVILAGKAGVTGHITIGDNTIVGPYSGVTADVPENQIVSGIPHMPHRTWLKMSRILSRLPQLRSTLSSLEKRVNRLEKKNKSTEQT